VRDSTYYAEIHLANNVGSLIIDSRPSDAIALALRVDAPIFVEDTVASQAIALRKNGEDDAKGESLGAELDPQEFQKFLEHVKPSDFGKGGTVH
jgi:bifunctional DNase/RNase